VSYCLCGNIARGDVKFCVLCAGAKDSPAIMETVLDVVERDRKVKAYDAMLAKLTATQERCTAQELEIAALKSENTRLRRLT
jgi:hypothetical protein